MSKSALLDFCAGERRKVIYHEEDGKTYIETRQDCEPLFKAARILSDIPPDPEDGWRAIGVIPKTVMDQALIEGWFHDDKAWRKWLADNSKLRAHKS